MSKAKDLPAKSMSEKRRASKQGENQSTPEHDNVSVSRLEGVPDFLAWRRVRVRRLKKREGRKGEGGEGWLVE